MSALGFRSLSFPRSQTRRRPEVASRDLELAGKLVCASGLRARARAGHLQVLDAGNSGGMSLWVDKYRPCSLGQLDYHKEQAAQLRNLVSRRDGAGRPASRGFRAPHLGSFAFPLQKVVRSVEKQVKQERRHSVRAGTVLVNKVRLPQDCVLSQGLKDAKEPPMQKSGKGCSGWREEQVLTP